MEAALRASTPPGLTAEQRARRAKGLDRLGAYWRAGVFPSNRDFPYERVPYFIDDSGVACAVGHLMIEGGAPDLAVEIAATENNDVVAELEHPGLPEWLGANGFTAEEAAWIQPSYGPCGLGPQFVCGRDGQTYECAHIAEECAGVMVDYQGPCGNETGGSGGATDGE